MHRTLRYLGAVSLLALAACAGASDGNPDLESEEDDLTARACDGASCATLSLPKALTSAGLAVVGKELYWVADSETLAQDGFAVSELQHCTLPACASVAKLPLLAPDGEMLFVRGLGGGLRAIAGGVAFMAKTTWTPNDLYVSDGASFKKVVGPFSSDDRSSLALDSNGVLEYAYGGGLRYCPFVGLGIGTCVKGASPVRDVQDVALTPTRAVVLGYGSKVVSLDRATLGAPRAERFPSSFAVDPTSLHTAGEGIFGSREVVGTRAGRVEHDTALAGPSSSVSVAGVITSDASDGTRLYVTAQSHGDVFAREGQGTVVRISATGRTQTVLATKQNARAVTVAGGNVYWIDRQGETPAGDYVGVVRFRTK